MKFPYILLNPFYFTKAKSGICDQKSGTRPQKVGRMVTLHSTHLLPVLSGIAPAKLRRNYVTNKISHHTWANKEHPLHSVVPDPQSLRPQRLKSRHPFYRHAAEHHNCDHGIIEARNEECTKHQRPKQLTLTWILSHHLDLTYLGNCELP